MVVVAAGNGGNDPGYADSPSMIAVSGTTSSDVIATWSSYGQYIDMAAPGSGIWTTQSGGSYGSSSGTSFASPIVAGVIALMKAVDPNLAPTVAEQILENTADDLGSAGWDPYYGYGRVNAAAAVVAVRQQAPDTQPPTVTVTAPTNGAKVAGLVAVNVTATDNVGVIHVDLYANGALVASDSTAPFGFSWNSRNTVDGPVMLTAYAFDAAGNQGVSSATSVTVDNTPPNVSIDSPADGSNVKQFQTVTIAISGSDVGVGVAQLSCYVDNKLLLTANSSSMNCNWNSRKAAAGAHTIKATAQDAVGNTATTSIQVYK